MHSTTLNAQPEVQVLNGLKYLSILIVKVAKIKLKSFNLLVYYIFDRFIQSSSSYSASSDSDEEDETLKAIRVSIIVKTFIYFNINPLLNLR